MKSPIVIALDGMSREDSLALAEIAVGRVWGYKVHDLLIREGFGIVKELKQFGNVFVDLKFHDIPATVEKEVSAMVAHGADLVTVHASGGVEMLKVAVAAGGEKVAAVTVLTSLPDADAVPRLARLAAEAGVSNLVCSPHEIGVVKEVAPKMCIITPGIRGPEDTANDQRRISSAREALLAGASLLVIGRPITKALHPERALEAIIASLV